MGSAYLLAQFVFQLPFGRLNDKWGRRPFILFAVVAHTVLSAAYIFLNSPLLFIIIRALEGVGTAAFMPAARAYISDVIPTNKRGEAFGLFGAATSGGILLGPAAGGFIGGAFGFTMPFIFCAATGAVGLLLAIFLLPESNYRQIEQAVSPKFSLICQKRTCPLVGVVFPGRVFHAIHPAIRDEPFRDSLEHLAQRPGRQPQSNRPDLYRFRLTIVVFHALFWATD